MSHGFIYPERKRFGRRRGTPERPKKARWKWIYKKIKDEMKNLTSYHQFLTEGQNPPNPQILEMIDKAESGIKSAMQSSKREYLDQSLQIAEYPLMSAQNLYQALTKSSSNVSSETMSQLGKLARVDWQSVPYGKILNEYGKILNLIKEELTKDSSSENKKEE